MSRKSNNFNYAQRDFYIARLYRINPNPSREVIMAIAAELKDALYSKTTYIGDIERAIERGLDALAQSEAGKG